MCILGWNCKDIYPQFLLTESQACFTSSDRHPASWLFGATLKASFWDDRGSNVSDGVKSLDREGDYGMSRWISSAPSVAAVWSCILSQTHTIVAPRPVLSFLLSITISFSAFHCSPAAWWLTGRFCSDRTKIRLFFMNLVRKENQVSLPDITLKYLRQVSSQVIELLKEEYEASLRYVGSFRELFKFLLVNRGKVKC